MDTPSLRSPRPVVEGACTLGEGPTWHAQLGRLYWTDIEARRLHWFSPSDGACGSVDVPWLVGSLVPSSSGGLVLATEIGFVACDADGSGARLLAEVEADRPEMRMNDGKCDPEGRFWAGTIAEDAAEGAGTLYCRDLEGSVVVARRGLTVSNGIGWSVDARRLFHVDSGTGRVDAFDVEGTVLTPRGVFLESPKDELPDGLAVDSEGALWIAFWEGWEVRRYLPDGTLDRVVRLPVSKVTSCCFGGADLRTLFITTAAYELSAVEAEQQPLAGALFAVDAGVRGLPTNVCHV